MLHCFSLHLCYVTDMMENSFTLYPFRLRFPLYVCTLEPMNGIIVVGKILKLESL